MESNTQNQITYTGHKVSPQKKEKKSYKDEGKPILGTSSYMKNFPNWKNGQGDIFHEKQP
jgi:hypothetical protein